MKKRVLIILMAMAFAFSLAGCGEETKGETSASNADETTAETTEETTLAAAQENEPTGNQIISMGSLEMQIPSKWEYSGDSSDKEGIYASADGSTEFSIEMIQKNDDQSEEGLAEEETSESSADDSSLWDLFLQEADQNEDRSKKRSGEEDDTQVNASTFSDALMSILPMERHQADRISKVWDSLSIGQAVYLQGVKEDDNSVLLAARAENGMDYYLTIRKEDYELIRISVGSEYGSTVFG